MVGKWGKVYHTYMSHNLPPSNEVEPKPVEDNARKLVLFQLDQDKLRAFDATTYDMEIQWIDTSDDFETKVVCKVYDSDERDPQVLKISKSTVDGKRLTTREPISYEEFVEIKERHQGKPHLTKRRSEFDYEQDGVQYAMKYDEFRVGQRIDGAQQLFCMLEVDAVTEDQRERFDPELFEPSQIYAEATGNPNYTGYKIIGTLQKLQG